MFLVAINFGHVRRTCVDKIQWKPNNRQKLVCPFYMHSFDRLRFDLCDVSVVSLIHLVTTTATEPQYTVFGGLFYFLKCGKQLWNIDFTRYHAFAVMLYYTILTQHRTQTEPNRTNRSDLLKGKENWWRIFFFLYTTANYMVVSLSRQIFLIDQSNIQLMMKCTQR